MKLFELKYKIITFIKTPFRYINNKIDNFIRGVSWGIFMRNNYDWDFSFFYKMERKKFQSMEKLFREDGHLLIHYSQARVCQLAIKYLDILIDGNPYKHIFDLFNEKYGDSILHHTPYKDGLYTLTMTNSKISDPKVREYADRVLCKISKMEHEYLDRIRKKYINLRFRFENRLWD